MASGYGVSDTYPTPKHGWVCYHCGEHFPGTMAGSRDAKLHFGFQIDSAPGCILKLTSEDKSLLRRLRAYEEENRKLRDQILDEDTPAQRAMARMQSQHRLELQRAEEAGYAKGLRDRDLPT